MARKTIDWKKLWSDYDKWYFGPEHKSPKCDSCNNINIDYPDWETQTSKIQELVNDQVRKLMEKKT